VIPDDDDEDLFLREMSDVRALPNRGRVPPERASRPRPHERPGLAVDGSTGRAPGVNDQQLARLRRGAIAVGRRLDLHGARADTARDAVVRAIEQASASGIRCLLVIHGRGTGAVKSAAIAALSSPPASRSVLAFCPAQPRDGGAGALYVLLRGKPR
jgi:DNA-nicking Smr family endonuclease